MQTNMDYYLEQLRDKKSMMKHLYDKKAKPKELHPGDTIMVCNDSITNLSNSPYHNGLDQIGLPENMAITHAKSKIKISHFPPSFPRGSTKAVSDED
jgi:hypothetical protein